LNTIISQSRHILYIILLVIALASCDSTGGAGVQVTSSITVTELEVSTTSLSVNHPLTISVTVVSPSALQFVDVAVGLMQVGPANISDADKANLVSCALGYVRINDIGAGNATTNSNEFIVNEDCLNNGVSASYNVFVHIDPDDAVVETDLNAEENNSVVYSEANLNNTTNQSCQTIKGVTGCIFTMTVETNPGIDLSVASFTPQSSFFILLAADDHPDVPSGEQEHNYANLKANIGIRLDGVDPSLTNGLPGDTQVVFDICPSSSTGENCEVNPYMPLTIYSNADSAIDHDRVEIISTLSGGHVRYLSTNLYAEGDTLTALQTGGTWAGFDQFLIRVCINKSRDAEPDFGIDAFTALTEAPGEGATASPTNNCKFVHVILLKQNTTNLMAGPSINEFEPSADHISSGTSSLVYEKSFDKTWGSTSTIGVTANLSTKNTLDFSGAHSTSEAKVDLDGWLQINIIDIKAVGNADVSIVDSGIDFSVSSLGSTVFSFSKEIAEIDYEKTWSISQKECGTFSYGIYIISLDIEVCASGELGFDTTFSIMAQTGAGTTDFANATQIGVIQPVFKPFVEFDASASASVSIFVARAGVEADITILKASLPLTGTLQYGLISSDTMDIDIDVMLVAEFNTLSGDISAFADVRSIEWCKAWFLEYPCGFDWARVASITIVSWAGETVSYTLLNRMTTLTLTL